MAFRPQLSTYELAPNVTHSPSAADRGLAPPEDRWDIGFVSVAETPCLYENVRGVREMEGFRRRAASQRTLQVLCAYLREIFKWSIGKNPS